MWRNSSNKPARRFQNKLPRRRRATAADGDGYGLALPNITELLLNRVIARHRQLGPFTVKVLGPRGPAEEVRAVASINTKGRQGANARPGNAPADVTSHDWLHEGRRALRGSAVHHSVTAPGYHAGRSPEGSGGRLWPAMAGYDTPVELNVTNEDLVVTPALARLLVKLARWRLELERDTGQGRTSKEEDAQ